MPKRKDETEQQWLDRVRAARVILNQTLIGDKPANELAAFMSLFHPDFPEEKTRAMIIEARSK